MAAVGANLPRCSARDDPTSSQRAARSGAKGAAPGEVVGADGRRRRRRRRKTMSKVIGTGAPADHTDNAPTSTTALSFPEPDPVALALCVSAGPPALVISFDPMLEELAASLVVSRPMSAAATTAA